MEANFFKCIDIWSHQRRLHVGSRPIEFYCFIHTHFPLFLLVILSLYLLKSTFNLLLSKNLIRFLKVTNAKQILRRQKYKDVKVYILLGVYW